MKPKDLGTPDLGGVLFGALVAYQLGRGVTREQMVTLLHDTIDNLEVMIGMLPDSVPAKPPIVPS